MFSSNTSQVSEDRLYVEDVFSTYLYDGNGSTQTITNGIDLAGKGGMVWIKNRDFASSPYIFDTSRGALNYLNSDSALASTTDINSLTSFNSSGFDLKARAAVNGSGYKIASWTFRKAPKFFDVVTYTGNGVNGRTIPHSLGVAPGCIIVKRTDTSGYNWFVYHRSNGSSIFLNLNNTNSNTFSGWMNYTDPTSTQFSIGDGAAINASGGTYVAYLFAHDTTSDGIIQCGSYTGNNTVGNTVTLGWEPQWVLIKNTTNAQFWGIYDNMRGMPVGSNDALLVPNSSGAEQSYEAIQPTATGFQLMNTNQDTNASGNTYIYIAIRRAPMRTPTTGTSVFQPVIYTGDGASTRTVSTTITPDAAWFFHRSTTVGSIWDDRLRGNSKYLQPCTTSAEATLPQTAWGFDVQNAVYLKSSTSYTNDLGEANGLWAFRRAPSFFDEVCYTGTGSEPRTVNHNLGVAPELMIVKARSSAISWVVYAAPLGSTKHLILNSNGAESNSSTLWYSTTPTSTLFTLGDGGAVNGSGSTYVAYLFASCPGVSKIGTYTGNGSSQTINCGFSGGARFVMIKRTDSTGDWYVWDTARGIVSGNDPHLSLNTTAAEVTTDDTIDTDSSGFVVNQVTATNVNVNAATYIFMAVA